MHKRISISFSVLMGIFSILLINIFIINLDISAKPSSISGNSKSIVVSGARGNIYDCNMNKIVNNDFYYTTVVMPTTANFNLLSPYLSENSKNTIYQNMQNGKMSVIKTFMPFDSNEIKSIKTIQRYSENQSCVHLIGHLDRENNGALGLEKVYNDLLSSNNKSIKVSWYTDAMGRVLIGEGISVASNNYLSAEGIQITIDLNIQQLTEKLLIEENIQKGAIVVLNADTSEILACASVPTFHPDNLQDSVNSTDSPFLNRAISAYSVGSVFKPFVAASAIEHNVDLEYECTGQISVNGKMFRCSGNIAHGKVDMTTAMENSCNCYFIALGQELGTERLLSFCRQFKFGEKLELADNLYTTKGNLPSESEINSAPALANLCFGQGSLLINPIQMACAYACFVNGGYYRPPTLMKAIIDENGNEVQKVLLPEKNKVLSSNTVDRMNDILESVVTNGNGNKAYSELVVNHGKTATAQSGWYENKREITHTWFCGYFEIDGKKYVAVILKEDGSSGGIDCAPIFKKLSEEIYKWKVDF